MILDNGAMMDLDEIQRRLARLDTACVCDAEKSLQLQLRVIDPAIRPIRRGLKLVGPAHTVQCKDDFLTVIKALIEAEPGEVIVIDSQGSQRALTGELFPTEAIRKGLAGIVNDGPCRDTAAVRALSLPYYARSVDCRPGTTQHLFATQIPVNCGGVTVHPGDILFGDDDGILVATAEQWAQLLPVAEAIQRQEEQLLARMAAGTSLESMLNFHEHCQQLRAGQSSKLEFRV